MNVEKEVCLLVESLMFVFHSGRTVQARCKVFDNWAMKAPYKVPCFTLKRY